MAAEVGVSAVSSIASEGAKSLLRLIKREISYVFKYQSHIDALKNQVKDLEYRKEMVEKPVELAKQDGEEIYKGVEDWLNNIVDFTEKVAKPITGGEDEAKRRPNLFKRYNLSKKAAKAAKEGVDILGRGNFSTVSYRPAPNLKMQLKELEFLRQRVEKEVEHAERQGDEIFEDVNDWLIRVKDFDDKAVNAAAEVGNLLRKGNFTNVSYRFVREKTEFMQVRGYEQFDSREKVFQDVMEALNDSNVDMIGVYGMGGVGKTTLVKQVARKVLEDKLFDEVIMAEITQSPDLKIIQDKLARDLGLEFGQQESVFQRADRLRASLKKVKRVLIILDNIWTKLELHAVGIPFRDVENERKDYQRQCTIILTSRTQDLLCIDMNSQKNFLIDVLSKEEAWQFFEKIVGDSANQSDFQPTAVKIVERCEGLPVALSTIANALKNKRLAIWKDACNQLSSSNRREIRRMDANVYSSIQLSYSFLESVEAKSLFLLCGLFSEGHPIKVRYLISYGMGSGLFKNVYTLEAGRNRVHALIDSLKTSCLLLDGDVEDEVKMHDIIHVVAASIAAEQRMFNITNAAKLKNQIDQIKQKRPTIISLSVKAGAYELLEQFEEEVQMDGIHISTRPIIPDLFFQGMKELKVLHLADINCVSTLPSSLGCLINIQTLCLENCRLEDVAIVGQLKSLEILSFRDSEIRELPFEIGQLTRLQLLDLSNCWQLEVIAPNVISSLSQLEELYMDNFTGWEKAEGGENASPIELRRLWKLTTLEIHIPNAETIPRNWVSVELERYKILIGDPYGWSDEYKSTRLMVFGGPEKSILLGYHNMKMLIKRTEYLYLKELEGFRDVVYGLDDKEGFPLLKHLHIEGCSKILYIVSLIGRVDHKVFPLLESLFLDNLIDLKTVCQGQLVDSQSFHDLRIIKVQNCGSLMNLFSFSMTKNLLLLQKVKLSFCDNLKTIFGSDMKKPTTLGSKIAEDDPDEKVIFPNLEKLKLTELPRLKSFAEGIKSVEVSVSTSEKNIHPFFHKKIGLPRLQVLRLWSIDKLRQIWHHQLSSESFKKLKKLDISSCGGLTSIFPPMVIFPSLEELNVSICGRLKYLFPYSMVNSLSRLQHLEISLCDSMEVVVGGDEGKLTEMVFPKLQYLKLSFLEKLTSFAVGINSLEFPSLLRLEIGDCSKLRNIISPNSSEDNTQPLFDEKVIFPSLEELKVSNCGRLKYLFSYSMVNNLSRLQHLELCDCESMEVLIGRDEGKFLDMVFPKLHYLKLSSLLKLTSFVVGINSIEFPSLLRLEIKYCSNLGNFISTSSSEDNTKPLFDEQVIFPSLEELKVSNCGRLKYLFSYSMVNNLARLQHLELCDCKSMEVVIWRDDGKLIDMVFSELHYLKLSSLLKLTSFVVGINSIEFHSLLRLEIEYCSNLRNIISMNSSEDNIKSLFDEKVALPNLTTLSVEKCNGLRSLMTLSIAESMVNLTTMKIRYCEKLGEIIHEKVEEENVKEDLMVFSQLQDLELVHLPSLTCFCLGKLYTLELSSLERFYVRACPSMETFSHGVLSTPKLRKMTKEMFYAKEKFKGEEAYCWKGKRNSTIHRIFNEMFSFKEEEEDEGVWEKDLNSTIQQLFKEKNAASCSAELAHPHPY